MALRRTTVVTGGFGLALPRTGGSPFLFVLTALVTSLDVITASPPADRSVDPGQRTVDSERSERWRLSA